VKRSAAIALLGAGMAQLPWPVYAQSTTTVPIRWGLLPGEESALPYYAQQKGFFQKAGIDVELATFRDGGAVTQGVISGSLDLGVTNSGSMCLAHGRGLPLYLVQCGAMYSAGAPIAHLSVFKDSDIRVPKDLSGKTIAISTLHDMMQAIVMTWLDQNGADSKSVSFVEIPVVEQAQAVIARRVDAASIVEPAYSRARDDLRVLGLPYSSCSNGKPFQTLGFIGNKGWVDRNAALTARVSAALQAAARYINRNPAEASAMLVTYAKLAPAVVSLYPRIRFAETNDPALLQPVIDLLTKYAYLNRGFAAQELFVH
jgi:NitT/TauT family transport system substrate-binding protein